MEDLQNACAILKQGSYTCVLCKDGTVLTDSRRGVKPLLELLESEQNFRGFSAADKVVGKAAAHLYHLLGVRALHAGVISAPAKAVLENNGIQLTFDQIVPAIQNRTKTGLCPIEAAVWNIEDSPKARLAILDTLTKTEAR